jgi:translation elongation factor EF-1alpha
MSTFFVQDIFKISGTKIILVGEVKSGILRTGMKLSIDDKIMEIKSIETYNKQIKEAKKGDKVGIFLSNANYDLLKNYKKQYLEFF